MRIGIDIRTLSFRRGGISQYTYNLLKNMLRIDSANTYYLFNYNKSPYEWDNFSGNVKEIILRLPQRYGLGMIWENILVPMALGKYGMDVWFSPDFTIPRLLRTRSVITIHDLIFENFHNIRRNKLAADLSTKVEFSVKRCSKIIAVSSFTCGTILERYKVAAGKVNVIPEAADERFQKIHNPEAIRRVLRRYKIDSEYILFVGEISERKNIARLLKAFHVLQRKNKTKNRKLVLAGKVTADTQKILQEVDHLGLQSHVLLTGYVPNEDLPFIYNAADLFVFPSLYEGFGIPPLEAMACQVPVVASSATSIPEVVGNGAILFDPYSVEDMAEKIDRVLDVNFDRDSLVQQALDQAKRFTWENAAIKTLALFESLDGGISRTSPSGVVK